MKECERSSIRRIAVLRALQLGDLLVATPALRALRRGFPHAEITLIGLPWAERDLVPRLRHLIDRFVAFPGYPGIAEAPFDQERTDRFFSEARGYTYDIAVQMHGSGGASNPFIGALGATMTVGLYDGTQPPALTLGAPYPHDEHEIARALLPVRLLGCPDEGTHLEFPVEPGDNAEAEALLAGHSGPLVIVHAGSRSPARRWPAERFAAVGDALAQRWGATIALTGSTEDVHIARAVADSMITRLLNLAGRTSLGGLAAVIARGALMVSNDTGPAHLAQAVRTPSVTLFGPADPDRWAPLDRVWHPIVRHPVACSPCGYWECPIDHRCLRAIAPETVITAAEDLYARVEPEYRRATDKEKVGVQG